MTFQVTTLGRSGAGPAGDIDDRNASRGIPTGRPPPMLGSRRFYEQAGFLGFLDPRRQRLQLGLADGLAEPRESLRLLFLYVMFDVRLEFHEQIVYPAMREAGLESLVDEAEEEHSMVKELVAQLEAMDATIEGVDSVLAELKANVEHHVQEEESEGFPRFREAVGQAELQALATRVEEAKQAAS